MKAGCRLRRQDRQAVVDGLGEGTVSRDGEAGDFAEGEVVVGERAVKKSIKQTLSGVLPKGNRYFIFHHPSYSSLMSHRLIFPRFLL